MTNATHPGPNVLERLSVSDLPEALAAITKRHVSDCDACRRYLDELEQARTTRMKAVPPETFVAQVATRRDREASLSTARWRRRLVGTVLTTAVAAAAAFVLIPRSALHVGLKGAGVAIHRNRGGEVRVLGGDDTIRAGDALRIVVTLPRPSQISAWFVDAHGRVDDLLAGAAVSLPAGEQAFPESAVVESPCLDLRLVVVVGASDRAQTDRALRQAVVRGAPAGDDWLPPAAWTRTIRCE